MSSEERFVLVGNALATMIAATTMAKKGMHVVIINPKKHWGGHFSTIESGGQKYDIGMVLHEFTSYNQQGLSELDVTSYDSSIRNDCGRFSELVQEFITQYQQCNVIETPKMFIEGVYYDDMLIANAMSSLKNLPYQADIKSELTNILANPLTENHASNKSTSPVFEQVDFETISLANHGQTLHDNIIEKYCVKLLNISTSEVVALYHRVPWLPLFYPETLLSYLTDEAPQTLPVTEFSYPDGECVGELTNKLRQEIAASDMIRVIEEQPKQFYKTADGLYEFGFEAHETITAHHLAWSDSVTELLALSGDESVNYSYTKCSISLAFIQVLTSELGVDFTTALIVDSHLGCYRVTNQSNCSQERVGYSRLVVEFNTDYMNQIMSDLNQDDYESQVISELIALNIINSKNAIKHIDIKHVKNALVLPTKSNMATFNNEMTVVDNKFSDVSLLGPACGFYTSSINNQVVQGLKLTQNWANLDKPNKFA